MARLIIADASKVTGAEFFHAITGHAPRTKAQIQLEWDQRVARYIKLILSGCEISSYGNPAVREAKELIALRDADSTSGDPFEERARRVA